MDNSNDGITILNVDDNESMRFAVTQILATNGYSVVEAKNGTEALEKAKQHPELIVLDVKLPDIDGFEVCRMIKNDPKTSAIPILHISGVYMDEISKIKGLESGADGYITKPIDTNIFLAYIGVLIKNRSVKFSLKESEQRYRGFVENFRGIAFRMSPDSDVIFIHGAVLDITGYSEESLIKGTVNWNDIAYADDKKARKEKIKQLLSSPGYSYEHEYRIVKKDGSIAWVNESIQYINESDGESVYLQGTVYDITSRINAENEKKQLMEKLMNTEKLASLGKLAGGMAHEINNPLTSILTTAELVMEDIEDNDSLKEDISQIIEGSKRIRDTVKGFLQFARSSEYDFQPHDIHQLIEKAIGITGRDVLKNINIVNDYSEDVEKLNVSRYHIEEVFVNIISNSLDSMAGKGELKISTRIAGPDVVVEFIDSGCGISPENIKKIFEPYFTTKEKKGTGIGLSSSVLIIQKHNGRLTAHSDGPGSGARFSIYLPHEITVLDQ